MGLSHLVADSNREILTTITSITLETPQTLADGSIKPVMPTAEQVLWLHGFINFVKWSNRYNAIKAQCKDTAALWNCGTNYESSHPSYEFTVGNII